MRKAFGYLSGIHARGGWIGLTVSGRVGPDGQASLGTGIGLIIVERFSDLPRKLGDAILSGGHHAYVWPEYKIMTIPFSWESSGACVRELIEQSGREVLQLLDEHKIAALYVPESCYGGAGAACVESSLAGLWDDRVLYLVSPDRRDHVIPENCPIACPYNDREQVLKRLNP
ncbi:MAG: hypothetical protein OEV08_02315 [Nitrospira sp.]|nr:hypothetical protein [Nitrospira sp.]